MKENEQSPAEVDRLYALLEQVDRIENAIERTLQRDQLLEELSLFEDEIWDEDEDIDS